MVTYQEIQASNALINDATGPRVAIFVGGTSGIGKFTIKALVATGTSVRIYLVGRKSAAERMQAYIQELHSINPKAEIVWTEAEVSLMAETKRVCDVIKSKESRVDLVFLSAGYAPFQPRTETAEGLEVTQSLEYYSRMLFILHLLPLLDKAEAPRVVSVLGGGLERNTSIILDDLDLRKPGNYGVRKGQGQFLTMNSTTMEKMANDNPGITFVHSWPGWVDTGNVKRGMDPNSYTGWFFWLVVEPLIKLLNIGEEVSGQRHLFESTSAHYGGRGVPWNSEPGLNTQEKTENGLFLVNFKANCTPNAKVLAHIRENAQEKVWEHLQEVLRPYL